MTAAMVRRLHACQMALHLAKLINREYWDGDYDDFVYMGADCPEARWLRNLVQREVGNVTRKGLV